jgi:Fe(3+) dicitrate transport protein
MLAAQGALAQPLLSGVVTDASGKPLYGVRVAIPAAARETYTDSTGNYALGGLPPDLLTVYFYLYGYQTQVHSVPMGTAQVAVPIVLEPLVAQIPTVVIDGVGPQQGPLRMDAISNFGMYEGKKSEVILPRGGTMNLSTNNSRQLYARITGLNIWESDQAGLQLGIGGRGLNPDRTSNFNTRQNGYDISADAHGYPESYYTPPAEALESIEIVRGAGALQYGTQFGGMVNFRFRRGPHDKPLEITSRQTVGSWGYFGSFNSAGGTVADGKLNYYVYYNHKRGNGFRPNSGFAFHNAFASLSYTPGQKLKLELDLTKMHYLAQQPGGLTDARWAEDPQQSIRPRNWFLVHWNLLSLKSTWYMSQRTQLQVSNIGLIATRQSLGNLESINVVDFGQNRTLIQGQFNNIGNESRLVHRMHVWGQEHTVLVGVRLYRGYSTALQGDGSNGRNADFRFLNPHNLENSDYTFPNYNYAAFAEYLFRVSERLSFVPGLRLEHLHTMARGYYKQTVRDAAGNIVVDNAINERLSRSRSFAIAGIGARYKPSVATEWYGNLTQNYRAISFTDLRINNPNLVVDPGIADERGYTADLGLRGNATPWLRYEATLFYLLYRDKIGQVLRADQAPLFKDYRWRGNVSDARTRGVEAYAEADLHTLLGTKWHWTLYANTAWIDGRYINTEETAIRNRRLEMVAPFILRTGTSAQWGEWVCAVQYAYTARHYSDATNALRSSTSIEGEIPAYAVADLSLMRRWGRFTAEGSCNNLFNTMYFTRRAEAYPGPGIIPADGRAFYITLQYKW